MYVEIDRHGNIYNHFIESDPVQADADARDTFTRNTQDLQDANITWVDVVMEGTKVKVTSEFEIDTFLLSAFTTIPPKIRLIRNASADCTAVPLIP